VRSLGAASSRALALIDSRWGVAAAFVAALGVWWLQAIAMPLRTGRDFNTYIGAYAQLFESNPVDLGYVLGRTPGAPLVAGALLDFAGGALAEPGVSLLYALSITAWFLAARRYGAVAAIVATIVLLAYPSYGILFHELASDSVFAAAFAGWSLLAVRVLQQPSTLGFVLLGAGVALLALIRPTNEALVVLALLALLVPVAWARRLAWAAAFVLPLAVVVAGWTVHNGLRYDNYTFSRAGNMNLPFWRAYLVDRIVRPENGPSSRALAEAVERDLLPKEPYRSYRITLDEFFTEPTPRMWADLLTLSDILWGWHSNHAILRDVAIEAIRKHPLEYVSGVADTSWQLLYKPVFRVLGAQSTAEDGGAQLGEGTGRAADAGGGTVIIAGKRLPKPSEGEAIPSPAISTVTTPDNSIRTVWTSPTSHHLVFDHPGDEERYLALQRRLAELGGNLPGRSGNATLALRLNQASRWYLPPVLFLVVGLLALAIRRPVDSLALVAPTLAGLVVILVTAAGLHPTPHFSVPIAPAFVLLATGAVLGPRRPGRVAVE
jgi:hypothetical protein